MSILKRLIKAHKFFVRESQFYLNGNWACYKPFTRDQILYYPIAYLKFMSYECRDILRTK